MTPAAIAADLAELARLVQHLSPDWQNPDRFYDARSELAERIRRLPRAEWPPAYRCCHFR